MKPGRTHTIGSRLALLVTASVIPASLIAVMPFSYNHQRERAGLVRDVIAMARALTNAWTVNWPACDQPYLRLRPRCTAPVKPPEGNFVLPDRHAGADPS